MNNNMDAKKHDSKFKLQDLQVESFVTELEDEDIRLVKGGSLHTDQETVFGFYNTKLQGE